MHSNRYASFLRFRIYDHIFIGECCILLSMNLSVGCTTSMVAERSCLREQAVPLSRLDYKSEDHWSCIAHLSAEDMLKSAVIEKKKFKHSPRVGAVNPLGQKFYVNRKASSLWSFVASLKRISSTSDFIHIFSRFNKCEGQTPQETKF